MTKIQKILQEAKEHCLNGNYYSALSRWEELLSLTQKDKILHTKITTAIESVKIKIENIDMKPESIGEDIEIFDNTETINLNNEKEKPKNKTTVYFL